MGGNTVKLREKGTGTEWDIPRDELQQALDSGFYETPENETVRAVLPGGYTAEVEAGSLDQFAGTGIRAETKQEFAEAENQARIEREHGGIGGAIGTALETVADTASLGMYGAAARALAPEYAEDMRERAKAHPTVETVAEVGSVLVPGAGLGRVGQLSREVTPLGRVARWSEKQIASGQKFKGYVVEGMVTGAASGLRDVTMSDDPVTVERLVSSVGTGLIAGGAIGGGFAGVDHVMTKAWGKFMDRSRRKAETAALPKATVLEDGLDPALDANRLATMSKQELRAARNDELTRLKKANNSEIKAEVDRIRNEDVLDIGRDIVRRADEYRADERLYKLTSGDKEGLFKEYSQHGKVFSGVRRRVRSAMDNVEGLAENPTKLLDPLQREAQVLDNILADRDGFVAAIVEQNARLVSKIDKLEGVGKHRLSGDLLRKYGDFADVPISRQMAKDGIPVDAADVQAFRQSLASGEYTAKQARILDDMQDVLAENRALQESIKSRKNAWANPQSARLAELEARSLASSNLDLIDEAIDQAGKPRGPLEWLIDKGSGMVPGGRLIREQLNARAANAANTVAEQSAKAAEKILEGMKRGRASYVPLSLHTLKSTSLSADPQPKQDEAPKTLKEAFKLREAEIRKQVMASPMGTVITPQARQSIAANLAGIRAVDPVLADRMESVAVRQVEFLARKLPPIPDTTIRYGKSLYSPSNMQMRAWARYVAAVADPNGIEERVSRGTVTAEDTEAMREVYPARFEAYREMVLDRLQELQETLPHSKRVALSIFTGVPVDPAMEPRILAILQGNFAEEPGTEGGMVAPRARPQFGSISKPAGTPAQERAS